MGRQVYRPPKDDRFKPGEGFVELERIMRALTRKEEDKLLKRATREALDKMWRRKGIACEAGTTKGIACEAGTTVVTPKRRRITYI